MKLGMVKKERKQKQKKIIQKHIFQRAPTTSACMQTHLTYLQKSRKKKVYSTCNFAIFHENMTAVL